MNLREGPLFNCQPAILRLVYDEVALGLFPTPRKSLNILRDARHLKNSYGVHWRPGNIPQL